MLGVARYHDLDYAEIGHRAVGPALYREVASLRARAADACYLVTAMPELGRPSWTMKDRALRHTARRMDRAAGAPQPRGSRDRASDRDRRSDQGRDPAPPRRATVVDRRRSRGRDAGDGSHCSSSRATPPPTVMSGDEPASSRRRGPSNSALPGAIAHACSRHRRHLADERWRVSRPAPQRRGDPADLGDRDLVLDVGAVRHRLKLRTQPFRGQPNTTWKMPSDHYCGGDLGRSGPRLSLVDARPT